MTGSTMSSATARRPRSFRSSSIRCTRMRPRSRRRSRAAPPAPACAASVAITDQQWKILELLAQGMPNKLIARKLGLAPSTVKNQLTTVFGALGVSNRTQAAMAARALAVRKSKSGSDSDLASVLYRPRVDRALVAAIQVRLDDRDHARGHGAVGGIRGPAEMRGEHHAVEAPQRRIKAKRFLDKHIESRAGDRAFLQDPRQRLLVDDRAARGVDEDGVPLHQAQPALVQQPAALVRKSKVDGDDVRALEELVELHQPGGGLARALGRERRPPGQDLHAERSRDRRHLAADPAEPDDAELLAAQRPTGKGGPLAAVHRLVGLRNAPHHRKHQAKGELDRRVREHPHRLEVRRGHAEQHARACRGGDIDVVGVVAGLGDELEGRKPLEEGRVEARALAQRDQDRVLAQPIERGELLGEDVHRHAAAQARDGGVVVENTVVIVEYGNFHLATRRVPVSPRSARERLGGLVMRPMRPPPPTKSTSAAIFGPMLPGSNWSSAWCRRASARVMRARPRWVGLLKSSATFSTPVGSTRMSASMLRASRLEARSLSITASTPRRSPVLSSITGMPPPPQATTT